MTKITFPAPTCEWGTVIGAAAAVGTNRREPINPSFQACGLTFTIEDKPLPKSKAVRKLEDVRRRAVKAHKLAYMALYVREPSYEWVGVMCRINGFGGVNLKRLKELTKGLEKQRKNA